MSADPPSPQTGLRCGLLCKCIANFMTFQILLTILYLPTTEPSFCRVEASLQNRSSTTHSHNMLLLDFGVSDCSCCPNLGKRLNLFNETALIL